MAIDDELVHGLLGVITYDETTDTYRMSEFMRDGVRHFVLTAPRK